MPSQHAITAALGHDDSLTALVNPGGRLYEQMKATVSALRTIPGVTVNEPGGALYVFPRLDPDFYAIEDDERLVLDFLDAEHILLVHGRAFNWPHADHLRIAFMPQVAQLQDVMDRLARFLGCYSQATG